MQLVRSCEGIIEEEAASSLVTLSLSLALCCISVHVLWAAVCLGFISTPSTRACACVCTCNRIYVLYHSSNHLSLSNSAKNRTSPKKLVRYFNLKQVKQEKQNKKTTKEDMFKYIYTIYTHYIYIYKQYNTHYIHTYIHITKRIL